MRAVALALVAAALCGCNHYADFTLPEPKGPPQNVHFRWEVRPEPVLTRGAAGEWDSVDTLNPSVITFAGKLWNLYSGFDGKTWHTGVAESADGGDTWTRRGRILSPAADTWEGSYIAANGSAFAIPGQIWYWYQASDPPRIGLARSSDGKTWAKNAKPVLDLGPIGSWDERGVADPNVVRMGDYFYLYYLGQDRAHQQRLGVARSTDGVYWTKLRSNPILELGTDHAFDEQGLGEPAVWMSNGSYWMLYTGRDRTEMRRIGLARSRDGVHWERSDAAPVLAGDQAWNSKVVCDPSIQITKGEIRVWFGGGNVARPDERLNGQIGLAVLRAIDR